MKIPKMFQKKPSDSIKINSDMHEKLDISGIWNAPTYTNSRRVKPDASLMEENRLVCYFPDSEVSEYYTQIRTRIQQKIEANGWKSIMITSPGEKTGKTLTSINMALSFAKNCDDTVLLVDCDFRNQTIHELMGISSNKGLADVILNGTSMTDVMIWPDIDKMTLISGGKPVQGSTELIGSPHMSSLISEMKDRYKDRYVLFDVPAALDRADALTFAPLVDCILIVIQEGKTTNKEVNDILNMLPNEKILGFIYNKKS